MPVCSRIYGGKTGNVLHLVERCGLFCVKIKAKSSLQHCKACFQGHSFLYFLINYVSLILSDINMFMIEL